MASMREELTDLREHLDRGFAEMCGKLDTIVASQERIVDVLNKLIERPGGSED
jgi:hypothetical protein